MYVGMCVCGVWMHRWVRLDKALHSKKVDGDMPAQVRTEWCQGTIEEFTDEEQTAAAQLTGQGMMPWRACCGKRVSALRPQCFDLKS